MITPGRADALIATAVEDFGVEPCALTSAHGRILREAILCDRAQPPFDRVTMDGIAIRTSTWEAGARVFNVAGIQAAGAAALGMPEGDTCVEVMTGAMLPTGADCVIPVEQTSRDGDHVAISEGATIASGQFIHPAGSDAAEGTRALDAGCVLNGPRIAIAASMGKAEISVARLPRVAIVSTGDELVDVDTSPEPYQIRRSNSHGIAAMLSHGAGINAECHHLRDDFEEVRAGLERIVQSADIVILSGGVSMGKFDHVPSALEATGAQAVFHKIAQRPGKPMWFGRGAQGQAIFALPGNPVSSLVCARRYVWPYIQASMGASPQPTGRAALSEAVQFKPKLNYFLPVAMEGNRATPCPANTSGDFVTLGTTSGFVSLPTESDNFPEGYACDYYEWL